MAENGRLSARQEKAILALLAAPTIRHAVRAVRVGETTLYTWLKDVAFADAYHEARATAVSQAIARLQQASGEAVDCLKDVMCDLEAGASARVMAATKILDMAFKSTEVEELKQRITALEAAEEEEPDARAD
jgi:hypothetical protein